MVIIVVLLMIKIVRTNAKNQDFVELIKYLDVDLAERDGKDHAFYAQFNKIDDIKHAVILYDKERALGCGAMKKHGPKVMEIKRMYTDPEKRGKGIASKILAELENWATELGYTTCVLETGKRQAEAVRLYKKKGYKMISNYGQYANVENSLCFEKQIQIVKF